ncbi:hypothetical protein P280DRAFT_523831 [Massarina eburnea CBS 473.64]|uniref:Uncharacterized protein n=1 Tax=Massarina eburnea CBS 473.64 TaxID=1395130 RepID=A0A6A6RIA5_9PLEO|nr:hypothetical protein P280DRAFT_523831 [Massarina eburnea CBS 473.64]
MATSKSVEGCVKSHSRIPVNPKDTPALTSAFANGWNNLPVELKLHVLSFDLVLDKPIDSVTLEDNPKLRENLFNYLRMGPEIATLARIQFYYMNEWEVSLWKGHNSYFWRYKNPGTNHLLRRLTVSLSKGFEHWIWLANLAAGGYGFRNQSHVTLCIDARAMMRDWPDFDEMAPIIFRCHGQVKFRQSKSEDTLGKQKRLREKIQFDGEVKRVYTIVAMFSMWWSVSNFAFFFLWAELKLDFLFLGAVLTQMWAQ